MLKPGASHERHLHRNCDEFFIVLKGQGHIITDKGLEPSVEGDVVYSPRGCWHGFNNTSNEDVVLVWGWMGAGSIEDSGYEVDPNKGMDGIRSIVKGYETYGVRAVGHRQALDLAPRLFGPTLPPPLAVQILRWTEAPGLAAQPKAAAAGLLLLALVPLLAAGVFPFIGSGSTWLTLTAAGLAMGMTLPQTYRFVLLPMAFRIVIPPLTSESMNIIKNSSVAFAVSIAELTMFAMQAGEETARNIEMYLAVTGLYFISAFAVNRVALLNRSLDRREHDRLADVHEVHVTRREPVAVRVAHTAGDVCLLDLREVAEVRPAEQRAEILVDVAVPAVDVRGAAGIRVVAADVQVGEP